MCECVNVGSSINSYYSSPCLHEDFENKFVIFVRFVFKNNK